MLYLNVRSGLCNRLRAIASAKRLARDAGDELCVVWGMDWGMRVNYTSIMNRPKEFTLLQSDDKRFDDIIGKFKVGTPLYYSLEQINNLEIRAEMIDEFLRNKGVRDFYFETNNSFYSNVDYDWFSPKSTLEEAAQLFMRQLPPQYIGIHIRRTDNIKSKIYSPLYCFEDIIDQELQQDGTSEFFLASDDAYVKDRLQNRFGTCVHTRQSVAERFAENGIADAIVDLIVLSNAKNIYGSYWSSFSSMSSNIGKVPYVCAKEENLEKSVLRLESELQLLVEKNKYKERHIM